MIRFATEADIPRFVELGKKCLAESHWSIPGNDLDIAQTAKDLIESDGFLLMSPRGFIGVVLYPVYFNREYIHAMELHWYSADARDGFALLKAAEREARKRGASIFTIGSQAGNRDEKTRRVYARYGFEPYSFGYMKDLTHG